MNNHSEAVTFAVQLLDHFNKVAGNNGRPTIFAKDAIRHLLNSCITGPIHGFKLADFPLWKLGTLLGENYVDEDVMNTLSELLYLRQAAFSPLDGPGFLFFPTFFMGNANFQNGDVGGPTVQAIRERLNALPITIQAIAFLACVDNHYTGYYYDRTTLEFVDTLGGASSITETALAAFQQLLEGINLPQVTFISAGESARQGPGSGSCGIGAFAWIERKINPSSIPWTNETSSLFRDRALADLILFNMLSEEALPVRSLYQFIIDDF